MRVQTNSAPTPAAIAHAFAAPDATTETAPDDPPVLDGDEVLLPLFVAVPLAAALLGLMLVVDPPLETRVPFALYALM